MEHREECVFAVQTRRHDHGHDLGADSLQWRFSVDLTQKWY